MPSIYSLWVISWLHLPFESIVQTNNAICGVTAESKTDKNDSEEIKNNNFKKKIKKEQ